MGQNRKPHRIPNPKTYCCFLRIPKTKCFGLKICKLQCTPKPKNRRLLAQAPKNRFKKIAETAKPNPPPPPPTRNVGFPLAIFIFHVFQFLLYYSSIPSVAYVQIHFHLLWIFLTDTSSSINTSGDVLTFTDLSGVFYCVLFGMACSLLVLLVELFVEAHKDTKQNQKEVAVWFSGLTLLGSFRQVQPDYWEL